MHQHSLQWMRRVVLFVLLLMVKHVHNNEASGSVYTYNQNPVDSYMDKCLAGMHHKDYPSPESTLYGQCEAWKERSCCKPDVTERFHEHPTWYNFDWNHCQRGISRACKDWLRHDLCFYECSPNIGPWVIEQRINIRDERFINVPLCRSECNLWFDACKDDFTCNDDWSKDWNWTTNTNTCLEGSQCRTFKETFGTAEKMCENMWGGSFKVTEDDTNCMVLWFTRSNPNDKVAAKRAMELISGSGGQKCGGHEWFVFTLSIVMFTTCIFK